MEVKIRSLSFLALVLFLALVSVEAARDLKSLSVLDVHATLAIVRGEAEEKKFEEMLGQDETLAAMTLSLVHRHSVLKSSSNASFEELLKQHPNRDAARVAAINAHLELAMSGLSTTWVPPVGYIEELLFK